MTLSEIEFLEYGCWAELESLFGPGVTGSDLPEFVRQLTAWSIFELFPAFDESTRRNIKKAVQHLYPKNPHSLFNASGGLSPEAKPLNWRQANALLALWAVLVMDDSGAVVSALAREDFSQIDRHWIDAEAPAPDHVERMRLIVDTIVHWKQAFDAALAALEADIVVPLYRKEIEMVADQWKTPNPDRPGYWLAHNRMLLSIDPWNDIETIMAAVRIAVEAQHKEMEKDHAEAWSEEERRFFGNNYIARQNPVKEFTYQEKGYNGTAMSEFLGLAAEALLVFELRKSMKPKEINKRFFPNWPKDEGPDRRPGTKRNTDRFNFARRLIENALSGVCLQL